MTPNEPVTAYDAASSVTAQERLLALSGELVDPRRKFCLEHMHALCAALGHPEQKFPAILIAGTNGKGSTASTLDSILRAAGYRTGLYTSPHLERVHERIQIAGREIEDAALEQAFAQVEAATAQLLQASELPHAPSFFEAMTATALVAFAESGVEIAVLEVGLGGRLDATNVVEPIVSVITDISLDHTAFLGSTIAAITREKAGILRKGGVMVTLPQHPDATLAMGQIATEMGVRGVSATDYLPFLDPTEAGAHNHYPLTVLGEEIMIESPLDGVHQQRNLALAIATTVELCNHYGYNITARNVADGIRATQWPGRLQFLPQKDSADLLIDVAHNPAGAWTLRAALAHWDPTPTSMTLLFGCMRDKALEEMAQILFPLFDRIVFTQVKSPRAASLESLRSAAAKLQVEVVEAADTKEALRLAQQLTPADGLVVVAGSVYLVGAILSEAVKS